MTSPFRRAHPYQLPPEVRAALERTLDRSVNTVLVLEQSRYARLHLGMAATTRPNRILLAGSGAQFIANPEFLLHEFFHVLHQWNPKRMTRSGYLLESFRNGYWNNRFEREAREFAAGAVAGYLTTLAAATRQHQCARLLESPAS